MKTISTKQLRENMPAVVRALRYGQPLRLSYRHKIIGTLRPETDEGVPARRGSPMAILSFLEQADFGFIPAEPRHTDKSFKEEIAELREKDLQR